MSDKSTELIPPKSLKIQSYEFLKTLGTGAFGRVRLAKEKETEKYVAIKVLKKIEIIRLEQVEHLVSECCILGMINNPFIVSF